MNQGGQFLLELYKIIREYNHAVLTPEEIYGMACFDSHLIMANFRIAEQYNSTRLHEIIQSFKIAAHDYFRQNNLVPSCYNTLYLIEYLYFHYRSGSQN